MDETDGRPEEGGGQKREKGAEGNDGLRVISESQEEGEGEEAKGGTLLPLSYERPQPEHCERKPENGAEDRRAEGQHRLAPQVAKVKCGEVGAVFPQVFGDARQGAQVFQVLFVSRVRGLEGQRVITLQGFGVIIVQDAFWSEPQAGVRVNVEAI